MLQQLGYTFYFLPHGPFVTSTPGDQVAPVWKGLEGSICGCGISAVSLAIDPAIAYISRARTFYGVLDRLQREDAAVKSSAKIVK